MMMRTNVQKNRNELKMAGNQASTAGQAKDENGTMSAAGRPFSGLLGQPPGYFGRKTSVGARGHFYPWQSTQAWE
jgi:hypothetical protein